MVRSVASTTFGAVGILRRLATTPNCYLCGCTPVSGLQVDCNHNEEPRLGPRYPTVNVSSSFVLQPDWRVHFIGFSGMGF